MKLINLSFFASLILAACSSDDLTTPCLLSKEVNDYTIGDEHTKVTTIYTYNGSNQLTKVVTTTQITTPSSSSSTDYISSYHYVEGLVSYTNASTIQFHMIKNLNGHMKMESW